MQPPGSVTGHAVRSTLLHALVLYPRCASTGLCNNHTPGKMVVFLDTSLFFTELTSRGCHLVSLQQLDICTTKGEAHRTKFGVYETWLHGMNLAA